MKLHSRIDGLLSQWESDRGRRTPEELCSDCPELLPALRRRIDELAGADALLGRADGSSGSFEEEDAAPRPPAIPGYDFNELIGRGGMGVVWRARQRSTKREVAVKTVAAALLGSTRAQRRFEDEVAFAGRLNHANIARVYDSGVHAGVFYYAMEHVAGVPLDEYLRRSTPDRATIVRLMETICRAVLHAHQRGIIHRDLKPSNILVTPEGRPVLLDFGLAKELQAAAAAGTAAGITLDNVVPGTPAYMSPEQADGRARDVDVRSDVYSLGVILFEALTGGRSPYGTPGDSGELLGRARRAEVLKPRSVDPSISTDLEAIVLKALELKPADRYGSADALADDLVAYLEHRPVRARSANAWYVARKWLARNRREAIAAAAGLVVMLTIAGVALVNDARHRAAVRTQGEINEAVSRFLLERLLTAVDPAVAQGYEPTLREVLDRASAEIGEAFPGRPLVEAGVRVTLGKTYVNLADGNAAETHLRRACELHRATLGDDDPRTQAAMFELAFCLESRGKCPEARELFERLLAKRRSTLGEGHPDTLACLHRLANVAIEENQLEEAERLLDRALKGRVAALGEKDVETIWSLSDLASVYAQQGRFDEAEPMMREALRLRTEVQGARHIDTLNAHYNLAGLLRRMGKLDEAERMLVENAELRRKVYRPTHPSVSLPIHSLGVLRLTQKRYAEAADLARESFDLRHAADGFNSRGTMQSLALLIRARVADGKLEEAKSELAHATPHLEAAIKRGEAKWIEAYALALETLGDKSAAAALRAEVIATPEAVE